jgi:hypothetical protein
MPAMRFLIAAALATAPLSAAGADVADPVQGVEAIYRSYQGPASPPRPDGVSKLFQIAGTDLRRRMVANGVCSIPVRQRTFRCALGFDPVLGGSAGRVSVAKIERAPGETGRTRVVARISVEGKVRQIRFEFAKMSPNGRPTYVLQDVEGLEPSGWRLSEATASTRLP